MPFCLETGGHPIFRNTILAMRKIMRKPFRFVCIGVIVLALVLSLGGSASAPALPPVPSPAPTADIAAATPEPTTPATAAVSKESCLGCHGPFDKLSAATTGYVAPSEEKGSPHRYVPHDKKEASNVPECANCHDPHPVPPTAADITALGKPTIVWCYSTCHHESNFTPCNTCHK